MKNLTLLIISVGFYLNNSAQALIFPNSEWHYGIRNENESGFMKVTYEEDVIIGDSTLAKLTSTGFEADGNSWSSIEVEHIFLSVQGSKVYRYNQHDGNYYLLYDLNANVGDTIETFAIAAFASCNRVGASRVDSTGVKIINGESLQFLYLSDVEGSETIYNGYIFERIGALIGYPQPLSSSMNCDNQYFKDMRCYSDNGFSYTVPDFENDCDYVNSIEEFTNNNVEIFPNPSDGIVNIQLPSYASFELSVYDSMGKLLQTGSSRKHDAYTLDLSPFNEGVYTILIHIEDEVYLKRVMKK